MDSKLITIKCPYCGKENVGRELDKTVWYWCMKCKKHFLVKPGEGRRSDTNNTNVR